MGKGTIMKARFPLLVLLGILFLASASVSFGLAYREREKENSISFREGREETRPEEQPWRERGRHEGEEEEEERDPREKPRHRHQEQEQEHQRPRHEEREQSRRGRGEEEEEEELQPREQPRRRHQEQSHEGRQGRGEEEEEEEEEQEPWGQRPRTQREREKKPQRHRKEQGRRGRGEEEGEEEEREPWRQQPQSQREKEQRGRGREQEEHKGEWRGERRHEDPEERERVRMRTREERQREERRQPRDKREQREEREESSQSQSPRQNNPYHFRSSRFQTRYKNRNGQIRVLQRFDQRSNKLKNLQNYRIVEYESRPNTLVLPHHSDAEYILVVLKGRATITVVNPNDRQAYNLERGDALRLPAGTTAYLLNRDDNQNLRVVKLAIPVNKPGQFDDFFLSSTQDQQSYIRGFSRNTLEVAFNTRYEEIHRILLGEEEQEQEQGQEQQSQEEGVIIRVSKEQIRELSRHAQSSSRRGKPSESEPFNLRSNKPIYSNDFGNFYEISPEKNPQLKDLELSLTCAEINEGALMLPYYNSKAIMIVVVNEGKGNLELVGLRERQQREQQEEDEEQHEEQEEEEEEEGNRQVQRYNASLSEGDIFVIPAGYPVSVNASSNLRLLGFGINAENNQRNFLAGGEDNVISQLDRQVKELAFSGSAQDVERLINNQRQSYFVNAQPQRREEGRHGRRGPLSSILGVVY